MDVEQPHDGTWSEFADLPGLAPVLDSRDASGRKNAAIDAAQKRALRRAGRVRGLDVLDFGCGVGRISAWLVDRGAHVEGVDATPEMIEEARRRVPGASFSVSSGHAIPFGEGTQDLVLSVGVLQYYVGKPGALVPLLEEMRRVLRPGGRVLAIEHVTRGAGLHDGAPLAAYREAFAAAGFSTGGTRPVRSGASRILRLAARSSFVARVPGLAAALALEARLPHVRGRSPLAYTDVLMEFRT